MSEGYGHDWSRWDQLVNENFKEKVEKQFGKHRYRNFEVFKSPKGRWMSFHNSDYGDIRIIDLETLDLVATNFYSNSVYIDGKYDREKSTYASHTNASTFVPTYIPFKLKDELHCEPVTGLKADAAIDWDSLISVPVAFNAWTVWAADFEFYVDVLDLRQIDDGIIKKWDSKTSFIIPREANHVRNFVKFDMTYWLDMKPKEKEEGTFVSAGTNSSQRGEYTIDFTVLEERTRDRYDLNLKTGDTEFYNMHRENKEKYNPETNLPWQETKRRIDEYTTKRKSND